MLRVRLQACNPAGRETDRHWGNEKGTLEERQTNSHRRKREYSIAGERMEWEWEREKKSDRERQKNTKGEKQRPRDGKRAARHAGRLSVCGLWEGGKDTVVGRVPALKLESGAKRGEPEPKAVWELPGAASPAHSRNMIYCRAPLQTAPCLWALSSS